MSSSPPPSASVLIASATPTADTTTPPHQTSSFGNLSPSISIIVLILVVTVIASASLCFLLRHLNRRCLRHLSPSASSPPSATAAVGDSQRVISSRRVSPDTNPNIDSLPLFSFSSVTRRSTASASAISAGDCAVCLSKFEPDDQLRLLPLCCHAFHALCVDTWLQSNLSCPLCRSPIFVSDTEILKSLRAGESNSHGESFRIEIGNVSRHRQTTTTSENNFSGERSRSYSIGSFEYLVDEDSEVVLTNAHRRTVSDFKELSPPESIQAPPPLDPMTAEVAASGRSWLKEYVDRLSMSLSSRAMSFRSSGRFFSGSSRRSDVVLGAAEWDLEAGRVGEEISEFFRWFSGV